MRRLTPLVCTVVLAACTTVTSLDYTVPKSAAVFDSRLLGKWIDESSGQRVSVKRVGDREYAIRLVNAEAETYRWVGRLGRLDDRWLLDLYPTADGLEAIAHHGGAPTHWPLVLEISDSVFRATAFDEDSMSDFVESRQQPQFAFAHVPNDDYMPDNLLLTDETSELFPALTAYARLPGVLEEWITYRRPSHLGSITATLAAFLASFAAVSARRRFGTRSAGLVLLLWALLYGLFLAGEQWWSEPGLLPEGRIDVIGAFVASFVMGLSLHSLRAERLRFLLQVGIVGVAGLVTLWAFNWPPVLPPFIYRFFLAFDGNLFLSVLALWLVGLVVRDIRRWRRARSQVRAIEREA